MPDMLLVAAIQIRDPVPVVIPMKIYDLPFQCDAPLLVFTVFT